jgi:excisionase family DNA binding protein
MENLTLSNEAYNQLITSIRNLHDTVAKLTDRKKILAEEYVDSWEASRILKISRRTLERYRNANRIPSYKVNRKVFFRLSDLEHYVYKQSNQLQEILNIP